MEFLTNLQALSSEGIVGWLLNNLGTAGEWAESAVKLAGLL